MRGIEKIYSSDERTLLTQFPPLFDSRSYVMSKILWGIPISAAATSARDDNDDVEKVVDNDKRDDVDNLRDRWPFLNETMTARAPISRASISLRGELS